MEVKLQSDESNYSFFVQRWFTRVRLPPQGSATTASSSLTAVVVEVRVAELGEVAAEVVASWRGAGAPQATEQRVLGRRVHRNDRGKR